MDESLTPRGMLQQALVLAEAGEHLDRIPRLVELSAAMQDRDESSPGYGNFRWSRKDGSVRDRNAVEFAMQAAVPLWIRHAADLPKPTRSALREMLEYSVQGCLRHRVASSYTNISLMNAENLILLGEALGKADVAREGYQRFREFLLQAWQNGIHEYDSPTYYGVDLECLLLIHRFARREDGKRWAAALLELFWTDIAANFFPPKARLAGARSRDYDYLRGRGHLELNLRAAGYLPGPRRDSTARIYEALVTWQPPARLKKLSAERFPRLVQQRFGPAKSQTKTHYLCRDVTLSCAGSNYGAMDEPMTFDLPGEIDSVRGYYIPDARRDPYGKKKIPAGSHMKTLHLRSFWCGVQQRGDALGVCVHRTTDVQAGPATLESHFVVPLDVDAFWVAGQKIILRADEPQAIPLPTGAALVLRKGTAAVGLRLPWSRGLDGKPSPAALVWDGNPHRAARLTVAHHNYWGLVQPKVRPGAAFWLRIGNGLKDDAAFDAWRKAFESAKASATETEKQLRITAAGTDGPLVLAVAPAYSGLLEAVPEPVDAVLAVDGEDLGRAILKNLEPVRSFKKAVTQAREVTLRADGGTYIEAESGTILPRMRVAKDLTVSGGAFVWVPGEPGGRGATSGSVSWRLHVPKTKAYWLWGRVQTPTPSDDSFTLRISGEASEPLGRSAWHTGTHTEWTWARVTLEREPARAVLLPKGTLRLDLLPREDGAKIDRLYLTPNQDDVPE